MKSVLVLLLLAVAARGETAQERGKRMIGETIEALGGQKFLDMDNVVASGRAYSFYHEELSGLSVATLYTRYLRPSVPPVPDEILVDERDSFGKEERSGASVFIGGKGYEITYRGARPVPEETNTRYRDTVTHSIFYILRERLHEPGMVFEDRGSDIVDNVPVKIVDITDSDNRTVTVYLHHLTHLPMRQVYYRRDPKTNERNEEITIWGKYRDVGGGVMWPYDIQRIRNGDRIFQMYSDTVEINKPLPGSLFALPPGVKILKTL
ncbi:MAG TPA: hypothetical protein VN893_17720 [Bryobacteraceae bacterium]|nr:hypothetical protein [Bryobacteraceae bacterium]